MCLCSEQGRHALTSIREFPLRHNTLYNGRWKKFKLGHTVFKILDDGDLPLDELNMGFKLLGVPEGTEGTAYPKPDLETEAEPSKRQSVYVAGDSTPLTSQLYVDSVFPVPNLHALNDSPFIDPDNNDILRCTVALFRHADRTPKQKVKLVVRDANVCSLLLHPDKVLRTWCDYSTPTLTF